MKADCPVCKHTCEGDTALTVTLALAQHLKSVPDDPRHITELAGVVEQIDREVTFAMTTAQDDSAMRKMLYDKCASLSTRLKTLSLYATSHLALAVEASRDMFLECGGEARLSDQQAARQLWQNLRESLLVAERKFRP